MSERHRTRWDELAAAEPDADALWELFHENSKTHWFSDARADEEIVQGMLGLWEELPYVGAEQVALPQPSLPSLPLRDAIEQRRTASSFGGGPIGLGGLASILHAAYGVTDRASAVGPRRFRTVPSGGALYPLELYVYSRAVAGLARGLYQYAATAGALRRIADAPSDTFARAFVQPDLIAAAAAVVLVTAVFQRSIFKYGERGYRFVLIEAGHVAQNVDLAATALHFGVANIAGFFDREVEALLELDGVDQSVVYAIALGTRSEG
jgi:SagB-type dehydrogenase family enzyme